VAGAKSTPEGLEIMSDKPVIGFIGLGFVGRRFTQGFHYQAYLTLINAESAF
jgi:hypothetical protein